MVPLWLHENLGTSDQLNARFGSLLSGSRDAVLAVMIGKGKRRKASFGRERNDLFGGVAPVRDRRMGMKVDHQATVARNSSPSAGHLAGGGAPRERMAQ